MVLLPGLVALAGLTCLGRSVGLVGLACAGAPAAAACLVVALLSVAAAAVAPPVLGRLTLLRSCIKGLCCRAFGAAETLGSLNLDACAVVVEEATVDRSPGFGLVPERLEAAAVAGVAAAAPEYRAAPEVCAEEVVPPVLLLAGAATPVRPDTPPNCLVELLFGSDLLERPSRFPVEEGEAGQGGAAVPTSWPPSPF